MKAALIADDLTGTNNAGVLVAKQGLATMTVSYRAPFFQNDCQVACVDTDSRYVAPEEARRRVAAISAWATGAGAEFLCNRVDNLLRGNIGAEVEGMFDHMGPDAVAIVAPAFPALGRLILDGHLMVNGVPVHENQIAQNDPFAPVRHSAIAAILGEQTKGKVAHVGKDSVGLDADRLARRLEEIAAGGVRLIVVDQRDDADVGTLALAMARLDRKVFPVDPGPLSARYLKAAQERRSTSGRGGKVLLAVGSVTPVTHKQMKHLLSRRAITPVWLDPYALIGPVDGRRAAIVEAATRAVAQAEGHEVAMLTTRHLDHDPVDLVGLSCTRGISPHALSKQISDGLAEAVIETVEKSEGLIQGCFSSGGDVTASLFDLAATKACRIYGDVIPLTAHVKFMGGRLDGLRLITKGGSIGEQDAAEVCLSFLQQALEASPRAR